MSGKFTEDEINALWFWQEGLKGWGYQIIRAIANGYKSNQPTKLTLEQQIEITDNFENAVKKMPDFRGELVRVTGDYKLYNVGDTVGIAKFTSFSHDPPDSLYEHFGSDESNIFFIDAKKGFKDMELDKILRTLTSSENEVINTEPMLAKITEIRDINIGGRKCPDWLGGGYSGGYNFKAHYLKLVGYKVLNLPRFNFL